MPLSALFLDMDHTLCDTAYADEMGLLDLAQQWHSEGLLTFEVAETLARHFMELLYKNPAECLRDIEEEESHYRGRLLQYALGQRGVTSQQLKRCREWVLRLMAKRMEHYDFFEGVVKLLAELRTQYRLIVISNGPLYSQEPKVDRVKLKGHVDRIILAGALPWQKPDVKIFQHALQLESLSPQQVCHIGDSLSSDIAGAVVAGIASIWVNAEGLPVPQHPRPDGVIANFCELPKILEQLKAQDQWA